MNLNHKELKKELQNIIIRTKLVVHFMIIYFFI